MSDELSQPYAYTDIIDAPPSHREVARYLAMGLSQRDAAAAAGVSMLVCRNLMRHEPFQAHLSKLSTEAKMAAFEQVRKMRNLMDKSREVLEQGLDRVMVGLTQDRLTPAQVLEAIPVALRVLKEIADRLPVAEGDISLVKTQRIEQRNLSESVHTHVTGRDIMALRERAAVVAVPERVPAPVLGAEEAVNTGGCVF